MKFLAQYRGLRKELYILFWGRVVTNMGALIWPMLTLILKNKLGFTPGEASILIILSGFIMLPATLIGGKLADKLDKKKLIVVCDMVTVIGYIICGIMPISRIMVVVLVISGIFAEIEWPSYDALVATLSSPEERERAYSLNYLGGNLGLVLAPTLGGLLFENHLNLAFIISGIATFSSTVLIFFFVKDTSQSVGKASSSAYENDRNVSTKEVFQGSPVLVMFVICMGLVYGLYSVAFSFLMPLGMESVFGAKGAVLFGTFTSVNALTVILGTPICTGLLSRLRDAAKLQLGALLEILGFGCFALAGRNIAVYYLSAIIFTMGEILTSLGHQPYITRRVPASHRGRMSSVSTVAQMIIQFVFLFLAGQGADYLPLWVIWSGIVLIGGVNVLIMFRLRAEDRRQFALLYDNDED